MGLGPGEIDHGHGRVTVIVVSGGICIVIPDRP